MARMDLSTVEMVEMAAQAGAPDALFELGKLYAIGRDGSPDFVTAHKWFNLAAVRGNRSALDFRKEISREMTAADIAEAQRQARDWLKKH